MMWVNFSETIVKICTAFYFSIWSHCLQRWRSICKIVCYVILFANCFGLTLFCNLNFQKYRRYKKQSLQTQSTWNYCLEEEQIKFVFYLFNFVATFKLRRMTTNSVKHSSFYYSMITSYSLWVELYTDDICFKYWMMSSSWVIEECLTWFVITTTKS